MKLLTRSRVLLILVGIGAVLAMWWIPGGHHSHFGEPVDPNMKAMMECVEMQISHHMKIFVCVCSVVVVVSALMFMYGIQMNFSNREIQLKLEKQTLESQNVRLELQHEKETREAKVKQRTAELQRFNTELESFAQVVSHDLQRPCRLVAHYAGRLQEILEDDPEGLLGKMYREAKEMQGTVTALLKLAKMVEKADFKEWSLDAPIQCALNGLEDLIQESSAVIEWDRGVHRMVLDKALMLLVFQNLIENAIKYNDERPRIKIACEDSGKSWLISVSDNGIGIKESDLERIFLFHVRTVKDENGTGVGLSVCRKVVSIHGGRIWAESGKNKGTTFKFLISKSLGPGEKHEKES